MKNKAPIPIRRMSIIDRESLIVLVERRNRLKAPSKKAPFVSSWRGDYLADISDINMRPNSIKVRDGGTGKDIKIL
jgi:hypothetical protein